MTGAVRRRPALGRLLGVLLAVLATLGWTGAALADGGGELHDVPALLVGPDVVTDALTSRADQLKADSLRLGSTESPTEAAELLESGEVVAFVRIDLAGTRDTLTLGPRGDHRRDVAVVELVTEIEAGYGRTVEVERDGERWQPDRRGVPVVLLAFLATAAGFVAAAALSILRGPAARGWRDGIGRVALLTGFGGAVGLLAGVFRPHGADWPVSALALSAAAVAGGLITGAVAALAGRQALPLAAVLLLGIPLPLVVAGDPLLLGEPWSTAGGWTVTGAAAAAVGAPSRGAAWVLSALVLGGAIALALLVLLARRVVLAHPSEGLAPPTDEMPTPTPLRRQLSALCAGALVAAVAIYHLAGQGLDREPPRALASLASTTSCIPTGPVDSVADLNAVTRLRGSPRMRGGDVGASAALQDERQVWVFGDTLRDPGTAGGGFVRNSMLVVAPNCLSVVVPRSGGAIIPDRDSRVGYWPMSLVVRSKPGYDLLTVMAQRVRTTRADDAFGFEDVGPSVVTYVAPVGGTPQLVSITDVGPDDPDPMRPTWGAASALDAGWLYLYGTARPAQAPVGTGFSLRVARVRPDQVSDPRRWRYWDGARWAAKPSSAVALIAADDGVSQTLSVFRRGDRWYAFSKRDEFLGQDLVFWVSGNPTGPFEARPPVAELPSDAATGTLRYMPLAHPDLLPTPSSIVVSYSRNRVNPDEVVSDPLRYRIRFLRVPLPQS